VLRDGQDQGLVEDEFAVIRALEKSAGDWIEVAGRRFEVASVLGPACASLVQDLERGVRRFALGHYQRCAGLCRGAAIFGGGSVQAGPTLANRLRTADIGIEATWVAEEMSFLLLTGARQLHSSQIAG
jgi:hypothetical protein